MKVVFLEEVEGSGRIGEVRNVANGYARNYLLPRKLAVPATDHNVRIAQARAEVEAKRQAKLDADAEVLAEKLVGLSVSIEVKVGEQGRLYGSVTGRDISEALEKPLGFLLEHRQVELEEPIRQVGVFEVPLRLSRNVRRSVQVAVLGEGQTLEELLAAVAAEEEQPEEAAEAEAPQEAEVAEPEEQSEEVAEEPAEEAEVEEEEKPVEEAEVEEEEKPVEEAEVEEEEKPVGEAEVEQTQEAAEESSQE
ncbi:MAG: 50S ribosomal protein L9 [Dehalococcoidia bacterium]|nr:MAG: 50S ribosomal protein L9 [Dehalococcoidia bacterium]